ncbi:Teneurin-4, partial [Galemys pyrenaicus]
APLHCSSASSTPIEQSPSPPPSPPANESQRRLLGNGVAQPTPDSDSEEEFVPNSFLVKSGSASLGVAANGHVETLEIPPQGLALIVTLKRIDSSAVAIKQALPGHGGDFTKALEPFCRLKTTACTYSNSFVLVEWVLPRSRLLFLLQLSEHQVPYAGPGPGAPAVGRRRGPGLPVTARVCALDHPGGLQNHTRLRTPPPPLSHAHTPNQHHAASINSLNRGNFTPRSNPSPAPTDPSLSGEPPASGAPEPAHAPDNWLLNSNIPLETRNLGKQPFLGTLQDNLIEMDILSASRHDGAYSDGHFLFKPGGTSPLFCTTSPGYPLTSSTVYSPPPRPLPRSTFARPAFNLKKPSKYCNWKCAALSAIVISATLVILLAYFVGKHRPHPSFLWFPFGP